MRLADFLETNSAPILDEWVAFARTCGPVGACMELSALRDHAVEMLNAIVADLRTPQTKTEQADKSKGNAEHADEQPETAAEVHGAGRAESGFTVGEMVAEYRALRASVLRLWTVENGTLTGSDFEDLMRFNEAIDQSTAESVSRYTEDIERSKEMFLAILGHDLRSPLNAVIMGSQFMIETGELPEPHLTLTTRILHSGKRMNQLVGDLIDFTRGRLGSGVPIVRREMDMAKEAKHAVDEISSSNPGSALKLNLSGDLVVNWDCPRISQVLANLLGNAVEHGSAGTPISLTVRGESRDVVLQVHNRGVSIPAADREVIFSPFKRLQAGDAAATKGSLGLGLYIAERIVTAHGGTIDVQSSDDAGTFFTVRIPR
ncbi:MAG: sensor histidine kinase [Gemmatimonadaceae bacterium]